LTTAAAWWTQNEGRRRKIRRIANIRERIVS